MTYTIVFCKRISRNDGYGREPAIQLKVDNKHSKTTNVLMASGSVPGNVYYFTGNDPGVSFHPLYSKRNSKNA
ncbi:MAG: hypothetical protein ABW007_24605 [Chitinophagaceae bacterium]